MSQIFKINSTTLADDIEANWEEDIAAQYLGGVTVRERVAKHTWRMNVRDADEYDTLFSLQGQKVSLTTTNFYNRNSDYKTYYGVEFETIRSDHESVSHQNVVCEFLVRL